MEEEGGITRRAFPPRAHGFDRSLTSPLSFHGLKSGLNPLNVRLETHRFSNNADRYSLGDPTDVPYASTVHCDRMFDDRGKFSLHRG